ncbi:hypothetical protein [Facklamia sp. 7083-14-GEN3]|uniref:hypothetical protein n=1 Tax=Facklamia sp. 7083-14-GEN3 TaxID=2973478 RepID=UPI00215BD1E4|nr:hypothetical protein [Facklamia sp. 7083-14-GEN3]MCR8969608.1 hypothetical protein [Facklamia sp. 7083-14-GEN3]
MNKQEKISVIISLLLFFTFLVFSLLTNNWKFLLWATVSIIFSNVIVFSSKNIKTKK